MTIQNVKGEGLNLGLVFSEVFNQAGCNAVVPGDNSASAIHIVGLRGNASRERAQRVSTWGDRADRVRIRQIHIRESERTGVRQVASSRYQLGHSTRHVRG